jgi:hypothetical protein
MHGVLLLSTPYKVNPLPFTHQVLEFRIEYTRGTFTCITLLQYHINYLVQQIMRVARRGGRGEENFSEIPILESPAKKGKCVVLSNHESRPTYRA